VALVTARTTRGASAFIRTTGTGVSVGPTRVPLLPGTVKRNYDREVTWWKKEIVYVQGNAEPVVRERMSLETFCRENRDRGEFLVVIASLQ
jgi:hypothetical protein